MLYRCIVIMMIGTVSKTIGAECCSGIASTTFLQKKKAHTQAHAQTYKCRDRKKQAMQQLMQQKSHLKIRTQMRTPIVKIPENQYRAHYELLKLFIAVHTKESETVWG